MQDGLASVQNRIKGFEAAFDAEMTAVRNQQAIMTTLGLLFGTSSLDDVKKHVLKCTPKPLNSGVELDWHPNTDRKCARYITVLRRPCVPKMRTAAVAGTTSNLKTLSTSVKQGTSLSENPKPQSSSPTRNLLVGNAMRMDELREAVDGSVELAEDLKCFGVSGVGFLVGCRVLVVRVVQGFWAFFGLSAAVATVILQ